MRSASADAGGRARHDVAGREHLGPFGGVGGEEQRSFEHVAFWRSVLRFFIAHPELDPVAYGPICDYLRRRRAVRPTLSMRGRTTAALLREVRDWHLSLGLRLQTSLGKRF